MAKSSTTTKRILTDADFLRIHAECTAVYGKEIPPKESWTVNGEAIAPQISALLPFENTDQGIGRRLSRKQSRGMARTEMVHDEADRQIRDKFRDERTDRRRLTAEEMRSMEDGTANRELLDFADPDPLKACARANVPPGYAYRFLGEQTIQDQGLRGYEIMKGPDGQEIKVGTLRLGIIPAEVADYRFSRQQELNEAPMKEIKAGAKRKAKEGADDQPLKGDGVASSDDAELVQDEQFHETEV